MVEAFKTSEQKARLPQFSPLDDAFMRVKQTNDENKKEAFALFQNALGTFKNEGIKNSEIERELALLVRTDAKYVKVTFASERV